VLLLIVPPKVLGDLCAEMHKNAASKVVGEIQKDHIHTPVAEIEQLF
jgi:protein required for attachment to host cells